MNSKALSRASRCGAAHLWAMREQRGGRRHVHIYGPSQRVEGLPYERAQPGERARVHGLCPRDVFAQLEHRAPRRKRAEKYVTLSVATRDAGVELGHPAAVTEDLDRVGGHHQVKMPDLVRHLFARGERRGL
jgi:alkyl sulfatase BDS1-like metallo-beta-lactamase superfamily hydrolase